MDAGASWPVGQGLSVGCCRQTVASGRPRKWAAEILGAYLRASAGQRGVELRRKGRVELERAWHAKQVHCVAHRLQEKLRASNRGGSLHRTQAMAEARSAVGVVGWAEEGAGGAEGAVRIGEGREVSACVPERDETQADATPQTAKEAPYPSPSPTHKPEPKKQFNGLANPASECQAETVRSPARPRHEWHHHSVCRTSLHTGPPTAAPSNGRRAAATHTGSRRHRLPGT